MTVIIVLCVDLAIQMSQVPKHNFVQRKAKNHCNQFLIDSLQRLKSAADMRRLDAQSNCYWRIINSVSKYPIPIICQEQCLMLDGVGPKMSKVMRTIIHKQYAAFLLGPQVEQVQQVIDEFDLMSNVESEAPLKEEVQLKKVHEPNSYRMDNPQRERTQSDVESVSSVCSAKYSIKEGSSASMMLKVLNSKPDLFWAKKQIKAALGEDKTISQWNFVKTLEKRRYITTKDTDGKIEYQITLLGQNQLRAFQQKHKPSSQLFEQTLRKIESKSQSPSTSKLIQRQYFRREDLEPFKVTLIIDNRQVKQKENRQYFLDKLSNKYGVNCRVSNLSVGDFLWVLDSEKEGTYVLDYIIQRKIADDLAASVMDGRYKHQKYRLKTCGIQNVYYMFEGHPSTNCAISEGALESAIRKTQLKERFKLVKTENTRESLVYLSEMHKFIQKSTKLLTQIAVCGTYDRFNQTNAKSFITMNDLTGLMLKSIPNVGKSTTIALVNKFGTIKQLYETLRPLQRKQKIKLLDCLIKETNRANHEAIARILIQILFAY